MRVSFRLFLGGILESCSQADSLLFLLQRRRQQSRQRMSRQVAHRSNRVSRFSFCFFLLSLGSNLLFTFNIQLLSRIFSVRHSFASSRFSSAPILPSGYHRRAEQRSEDLNLRIVGQPARFQSVVLPIFSAQAR